MSSKQTFAAPGGKEALEQGNDLTPRFGPDGLIACVAQDAASGEIMMLAHMNAEALKATMETGIAHYWSRSRGELWRKGETSGAVQHVQEMRIDCDQDAVLIKVTSDNRAQTCHTGRTTCFYRTVPLGAPGDGRGVLVFD